MSSAPEMMSSKEEEGRKSADNTADGNVVAAIAKTLDANSYATKKTIAQGLLDVALLTANASQLKYVLQVGEKHEFYTLMLALIIISIILQVTAASLNIFIALLRMREHSLIADILNQVALGFVTGTLFCDIIKLNLGLDPAIAVVQVALCVFLGGKLDINKEQDHDNANLANNIVLFLNGLLVGVNVVIGVFEMKEDSSLDVITTTPTSG